MAELKTAVIGVGHLGQHHARVYANLPGVKLEAVVDVDRQRGDEIARKHGTRSLTDYRDVLSEVDAVSIAVPTVNHYPIAAECLKMGIHVLLEKPMTTTLEEAEDLVRIARDGGAVLQIGHIERFNPAIVAVQDLIEDPLFILSDRISPFPFRSADIGVVLDLMIHDLDIILDLCKSKVKSIDAVGVNVLSKAEDLAHARIVFESGCVATLTASRLSLKKMRKIRLFQRYLYLSLDYNTQQATVIRKDPDFTFGELDFEKLSTEGVEDLQSLIFGKYLHLEHIAMDTFEPLQRELESFVEAVRTGSEPLVTGEQGLRAMKVAGTIQEQIRNRLPTDPPAAGM